MSLTAKDKQAVKALWSKISEKSEAIGAETLGRLFIVHPSTKTYFAHWKDLSFGASSVRKHGRVILQGVGLAVSKIDNMTGGLLELSEKHAFQLKVDPSNFKLMAQCLMVVIAIMYPDDFTPEAHVSFDKFLVNLALALSEKFR